MSNDRTAPPPDDARPRRATMRDVAREAGVSLKTVSRVVNGEPGVTAVLEHRVAVAIDRLGYQPDDRARFLRRSETSSKSLGFVQMDVANPFFSSILRGVEDVARTRGHLVLAGSSDGDPDREMALVRAFIARRVDGLIIVSSWPAARARFRPRPERDWPVGRPAEPKTRTGRRPHPTNGYRSPARARRSTG